MPVYCGISSGKTSYFAGLRKDDDNGNKIFTPMLIFDNIEDFSAYLRKMQDFLTYKIPSSISLSSVRYRDYRFEEISQSDRKRIGEILSEFEED